MRVRSRRLREGGFALLVSCALALSLGACKKPPSDVGMGLPDTSSPKGPAPVMGQRCDLGEEVRKPDPSSPEWVVQDVLTASYEDRDVEAAFQRFFGHFTGQQERWVKDTYWPKIRKRVDKLIHPDHPEDAPIWYSICRRDAPSGGKVKLFLKSYDSKISNPPVTLAKQADGKWKVTAFTP
ncbi:MAG: hypothetical protein VX938_11085 [Myxococcota bacterium]|nr:hypothetical protein [Myxococcota bacterium]